ncbi:GAF domain-containing protein [Methylobacterium platani]|uniref:GAF domain-containing protein n=1 Tax=Methylobacterium platani TaxID=427683 RepID=UPI000AAFF873|nr:GAF domain-containing protein [Methylobacterium platani]
MTGFVVCAKGTNNLYPMVSSSVPPLVLDPQRLAALDGFDILDTPAEEGFDDLVNLAALACGVPVALVSLVDRDRQWFKARVGFPPCETDLNSSVCKFVLAEPDILQVPDLLADPRTAANPLVTGEPFIRFYAGAPLRTQDGITIGSLCVIDQQPRPEGLTPAQQDALRRAARQVMTQLDMRRAIQQRDALRVDETGAFRAREALRDTQAALAIVDGDLPAALRHVVTGAMRAIPAAEGGVVELLDGAQLVYHTPAGTLAPHAGLRLSLTDSLAGHCATTRTPQRMDDALTNPHVRRDLCDQLKLRSAIAVPVLRGDTVLGVLKLQSSQVAAFTDADLALLGLFAGATTASLAESEARAQTRSQAIYWRGLFDRLSEGFMIGEVVRDTAGQITDWQFVEVNPAWGTLLGLEPATAIGRSVRDVIPGVEEEWISEFAQVVETGEAITFVREVQTLRRWYEGRAFKLDGDRFGTIFLDVTQRVGAELRRNALLQLGDGLRDLTTTADMTRAAAEIVGRTLGATRAGFGRIIGDVEEIDVEPDWTAPGQVSIAGRHRFDAYGDLRTPLRQGEPLAINDVTTDPRTAADPAALQAIGVGALVNMPVRERGRAVAMFIVHDVHPRVWTAEELGFLRNVADRLEAGVARVRAEELQGVLNHELAHRLKNTLAIVQSIASSTLRNVTEREPVEAFERRVLALSRAHDVLMHKSWTAAKMRHVMESVLAMQADMDRFALDGPDLDISPQAALSLSLLLHELATNALKYGALSASTGKVRIAWRTEEGKAPTLVLDWSESGGPAVTPPSNRGGFGSKLIRMGLVGTRVADLRYDPVGLQAEFRAPLADVQVQVH